MRKSVFAICEQKGADQPVHLHSLISTFIVCCLGSIMQLYCIIMTIFTAETSTSGNFIGNGYFLIKIYYILTEFPLSDSDSDSQRQIAFFTHF